MVAPRVLSSIRGGGPLKHPTLLLAAFVLGGGLYGLATSSIPSPYEVSAFWVGNLCAPWLVLSFLAGRTQRSWRWAVTAGALTDLACVGGFYLSFLTLDPLKLGCLRQRRSRSWR